jgi:transposase
MPQVTPFVGLDVHARQTHAGVLDPTTGELWRRRLRGDPLVALGFLQALGPRPLAVYEAGPTGFALARAAAERGLDVRVCAPGLIPRRPTDRIKTDARDAERLARLLAAGELSFVHIPTVDQEQLRDLVRAREDLRGDLNRARQRLSHFLRRRALCFAGPGRNWTQAHRNWLRRLDFDDLASATTFADYLAAVDAIEQRRDTVEATLAELAPESPWADDRPPALLPRHRHARGGRALRRDRRLRPLRPPAPTRGLPGPGALRTDLRREASPGPDH